MFSNKKTAKPGKTPDNYKQQIHNKLDSALEGLDIDIFTNHDDDSVIFQKKVTPDDCDNDTTIPYVDDQPFHQSSPIHSQFNLFVTPWAKPTLPTSIRPLRPSIVQKLVIPLSKKPAPVAVNPLLKTPQQFASLYPKLPTSTLATASIATTATSAPTVTSTTSTVVLSAIVPVTTTAATAGATATTILGTISTTSSTSSSDEIHSLRKHIQSINVNSTIPVTTQNQSYQPSQQPEYVQQPVYYTPRAPNHTMYPSNRYKGTTKSAATSKFQQDASSSTGQSKYSTTDSISKSVANIIS
ncbi:unnamed protein product [Mytilus coruscus]|uniref:Uncharacterized protein n=1 Tax=Mytilus coruscus TaxID=42192 RepID=A0A6J8ERZ1_MYTCO|nr:unnamed protein product [Mytilus coruscus]